jgi:hypothetical protein
MMFKFFPVSPSHPLHFHSNMPRAQYILLQNQENNRFSYGSEEETKRKIELGLEREREIRDSADLAMPSGSGGLC